jgi:hypothetical protein
MSPRPFRCALRYRDGHRLNNCQFPLLPFFSVSLLLKKKNDDNWWYMMRALKEENKQKRDL